MHVHCCTHGRSSVLSLVISNTHERTHARTHTQLDFANAEGGITLNAFSGSRLFLTDLELVGLPYPARLLRPAHFVAAFGHGVYVNT